MRGSSLRRTLWPMPRMAVSGMHHLVCANRRFAAHLGRPVLDGLDDVHVARAAAQVAGDTTPDLGFGRIRRLLQQAGRSHDHARRTEAALQAVLLPEAFLQRVEHTVLLDA